MMNVNSMGVAELRLAVQDLRRYPAEVQRLQEELAERTKAARYIMLCLGSASAESDEDSDEMSHTEIASMFSYVCEQWPWCDPRNTEQKGGE